jgi:RHS repeat-associated protein
VSSNSFQYTGRENDGTGLYYYRARYSTLKRFVSEDPIRFGGGDVNLYVYVRSNPLLNGDPLGLIGPVGGMLLRAVLGGESGAVSSHPVIGVTLGANMGLTVGVLISIVRPGVTGALGGLVGGGRGAVIGTTVTLTVSGILSATGRTREHQNIVLLWADSRGMTWRTSQCSTILPFSSRRKMSMPAQSASPGHSWWQCSTT